jgi:transposase InsO family protein
MTVIKLLAWKLRKINRLGCQASGIIFPMMCVSVSLSWLWIYRSYLPHKLAVHFTDTEKYFIAEASVYRLFKSLDLISGSAFIIKTADEFRDKTIAINQLWQTDFIYLTVIVWDWMYLSMNLDDYSRYIIAWKLCTTMKTRDETDTLDLALQRQAEAR